MRRHPRRWRLPTVTLAKLLQPHVRSTVDEWIDMLDELETSINAIVYR